MTLILIGTAAILSVVQLPHAGAQTFDISRHVIAGGGGRSDAAGLRLTGTIGQAEANANVARAGRFRLRGGFWARGPRATSVDDSHATPPIHSFVLHPNVPNPFNPRTTIAFELPVESRVRAEVLDLRGAHVRTLVRKGFPAGRHSLVWSGIDDGGGAVASGVYFVRIRAAGETRTQKIALLR